MLYMQLGPVHACAAIGLSRKRDRVDLGLRDKTAVVAGGTRGMGRATADMLAAEGCRVAVLGRTPADLADAERALRERGAPDVLALQKIGRAHV